MRTPSDEQVAQTVCELLRTVSEPELRWDEHGRMYCFGALGLPRGVLCEIAGQTYGELEGLRLYAVADRGGR